MDFADKIAPIKEKISRIEQQMRALPSNKVSQYNKLDSQRGKLNEQIDQMHRKHVQEQSKALEKQSRTDSFRGKQEHRRRPSSPDDFEPGYSKAQRGEIDFGSWTTVPGHPEFVYCKEIDQTCGLVVGFLISSSSFSRTQSRNDHAHYWYNNRIGEHGVEPKGGARFTKPFSKAVIEKVKDTLGTSMMS